MGNGKSMTTVGQGQNGQRQKPKFSVAINTDGYQKLINNTLRDPERARRFTAAITSAVAVNQELQKCDAGTILAGALLGESLNLSPSPQLGQYYLVPFEATVKDDDGKTVYEKDENGKDVYEEWTDGSKHKKPMKEKKAVFVLGYLGYLQLAIRSGQYSDIDAMEIKQGEYLGKDPSTGKPRFSFIEDDDERDELPTVGYMAYYEYVNGFRKTIYWSKEKMLKHADKFSPAFHAEDYEKYLSFNGNVPYKEQKKYSSFWYKDFDAMAKKTMIRVLISKWGVMSIDMQKAVISDNGMASLTSDGDIITADTSIIAENEAIETEVRVADITKPEFTDAVNKVNLENL